MTSRRLTGPFLLAATLVAGTAACSSTTSGTGSVARASAGASSAAASVPSSLPSSAAAGASGLAYRLHRAVDGITSDHVSFTITTGGQTVRGSGDQKLSRGQTLAYRLTESLPQGGTLTLLKVGTRQWVELPGSAGTAKPWVVVSESSTDPQVRALAQSLQSTTSVQPLQTTGVFVASARSVRDRGHTTVDGVPATHYSVDIDPTRLPADFPQKAAIVGAGLTSIPVELYVDGKDRPVRVVEHITVAGNTVDSTFSQSRFDAPVSISPPPAGQVTTR